MTPSTTTHRARCSLRPFLLLPLLTALFLPLPGRAQKAEHGIVEGSVTSAADQSPLLGATILIQGTVLGASTDAAGKYRITNVPPGRQTITISMLGFQKERREISVAAEKTITLDLALKEIPLQADEVVVTASKRPQSLEEVPVSLSLLEGKEIERRTIVQLDQALRYVPGVNMTESQVNVRGSSGYSRGFGTRVLLLVDGIPLLTGDSGEIKFDAVPMFMVERIEVVKGAGSALYGSSALGGVINVITKTPRENATQVRLYSGMYGSPAYPEWKWWSNGARVFNGVDLARSGAASGFAYLVTGGLRNNRGYRLLDDDLRWNLNGKTWFELSPLQNLTLGLNYTNDDHGNWISWRDLKNALIPPANADLSERLRSTKMQGTAQYRQTVDDNFAFALKAQYYRTSYDVRSDTSDFSFRPFDRTQSTAQLFGLEWQGNYTATPLHFLTFGVDGSYSTVDALTYGNRNGKSIAAYAQDDYKVLDNLNLSAGLRGDLSKVDTSQSIGRVNPRLGVAWTPLAGSGLRASFGTGFRAPSIAEKFTRASGNGVATKPNPALRAERSISYELGARQEIGSFLNIDVALFQSDFDDLIEPVIDTDGRILFQNVSRARIQGMETGIKAGLFEGAVTFGLGYTYMYPRDLTLDKILKYRPRHLFYANGTAAYAGAQLDVDFRYISRVEEIDQAAGVVIRDYESRVEIFVTDARVSYALPFLPLRAIFAVNNLFNYNYVEIIGNIAPIRNYTLTLEASL